jgi:putative DNA primase/helicase
VTLDQFAPLSAEDVEAGPSPKPKADKVPIVPAPDDAPSCTFKHPEFGAPMKLWAFRNAQGQLLGYDARFEYERDGKRHKDVLPLTYCQIGDKRGWRSKAMPFPRALYGLDRLAQRPDAPVVVAEGCKSADAAGRLLPDYVAISWPGGGNGTMHTDWAPLAGRKVLIWPDRDRHKQRGTNAEKPYDEQAGTITGAAIAKRLIGIAAEIAILDLADWTGDEVKDGWDAADALAEGWTEERAASFVASRGRTIDPAAAIARPVIFIRAGELHTMATEAETALIEAGAPMYVRGGIVRPVIDELPASHGRLTKVARMVPVDGDMLVDHLSRTAEFVKFNARKNSWLAADPPHNVAATVLARDGEWRFRSLAGVITAPTLRPDGTILSQAGYDPATRLLLLDPPTLPLIPDHPTRDDALRALERLDRLLDGFPFVDDASRSVALSALITPSVRGAMPVAPLHVTSAPVAGSGKSYLIDLASAILAGDRAPVIAAGRTEEETEKRLGAALLAGQAIISIDNVNGELGGDSLCQIIERPVVSIRPLGVSKLVRIESRASIFATGNNIRLVGDMTRRTLLCSLDPNVERPELRTFDSNPFAVVLADRGTYIAATLTIVRAYLVAGCPGELSPLASFETWSRMVRSAIVWLGRPDPTDTMEAARAEDPVLSALGGLMAAWHDAVGPGARTTGEIKVAAELRNPFNSAVNPALYEALGEVADDKRGGIDTKRLGRFLGLHHGRIVDGLKIVAGEDSHAKQRIWRVVKT